jgi:hypothetical protein
MVSSTLIRMCQFSQMSAAYMQTPTFDALLEKLVVALFLALKDDVETGALNHSILTMLTTLLDQGRVLRQVLWQLFPLPENAVAVSACDTLCTPFRLTM